MTIYSQLVAITLPRMTDYKEDLLTHDKNEIARYAEHTPFLHYSSETGTHNIQPGRHLTVSILPKLGICTH